MPISREEAELLRAALAEFDAQGDVGHADAAQDAAQVGPSLEMIASMLETINDRLNKLESVVMDDIVGGITGLYKKNLRDSSINGLKEKYGPLFDPHKDALDAFYPGIDIFEKLQDLKDQMSGEEDYSDDKFDGSVQEAVKELQEKIGKLTASKATGGDLDSGAEIKPEVEVEVSKEGGDEDKSEDDELSKTLEKFKKMKEKAKGFI